MVNSLVCLAAKIEVQRPATYPGVPIFAPAMAEGNKSHWLARDRLEGVNYVEYRRRLLPISIQVATEDVRLWPRFEWYLG